MEETSTENLQFCSQHYVPGIGLKYMHTRAQENAGWSV